MKKFIISLAAALLVLGCSPSVYTQYLEVRGASASGLSLGRKSISISYMEGPDSTFDRSAASALARALEKDYFGGNECIGIYSVPVSDSVSLSSMHSLVMDTEGDVVFLLNSSLGKVSLDGNTPLSGATSVDSAYVAKVKVPISTRLWVYDSMGEDKVHTFRGSTVLEPAVPNNGMITDDGIGMLALKEVNGSEGAGKLGEKISRRFLSKWNTEGFSWYYFEDFSQDTWVKALEKASKGQFADAVDGFAPLLKNRDPLKRACACYNIAMAFFLMEEPETAGVWLDKADALENLSLSAGLRSRIQSARK